MTPEVAKHYKREQDRQAVEVALREREDSRHRGVSISGLDYPPPACRDLIAAAEASAAREASYKDTPEWKAVSAAIAMRKRIVDLLGMAQRVEASLSSQDGSSPKAVHDMQMEIDAIKADAADLWLLADDAEEAR